MPIHVTTSNIKSFPLQPMSAVRNRIRQAARIPGIHYGQELHPHGPRGKEESNAWIDIMSDKGRVTYGSHREVPISLSLNVWNVREVGTKRLTDSVAGDRAPNRYITYVAGLKHNRIPVAFVNMHPEQTKNPDNIHNRLWEEYAEQAVALINSLHSDGYNVVYGGDMNKRNNPKPYSAQSRLLAHKGLDHIWLKTARGWNMPTTPKIIELPPNRHMDHWIVSASFELEKA